ncbi:site-specific recombinase XerD [Prevotella dentalis DSM 3688]|uniref:Phage integrase family site-specific recombinase n=1 Tax=Prevotella dentalis (strain ATCC 49559 / DSM 3688 / JCM 13448 / NCTC 12043 / ES 2772) TaxID=908937 RepID=F9D309_PREDD|nr:site-specific integrase [Prevotella dentalis]AGB28681.1 site-specific recombinase XerD [Prevotella dentalis DSM 3688]EGQ15191.1 phage integrase family site-specific recombinase [Prevotella dentalis DSM 3688]
MDKSDSQAMLRDVSVNFNLRDPKSNRPTQIYMVIYANGKQTKIPTGCKILSNQWDNKKQEPIISKVFSNEINKEAIQTLRIINAMKFEVLKKSLYNCSVKFNKFKINKDMTEIKTTMTVTKQFLNSKRTPKATNMMKKAFDEYLIRNTFAKSTLTNYGIWCKMWMNWVTDVYKRDSCKAFSQEALNDYVNFLLKNGGSNVTVSKKVKFISMLINDHIAINNKYGIRPIVFKNLKDKRKKEDKLRGEILDDEIKILKEIVLPTRLDKWRKAFVLQLLTGQRCSDLLHLLKGEYKVQDDVIILKTQKCGTNAYIGLNDEITHLIEELNEQFIKYKNEESFKALFNRRLKEIAKMAHLDRTITYEGPYQTVCVDKLCDVISTHFARHTFVTKMLRVGFSAEEVGKMIGDSAQTVLKNYGHPTEKDEINVLKKAEVRINNVQEPTSQYNEEDELKKVLLMMGISGVEIEDMNEYQIWEILIKEHGKLMELGVNVKTVKEIYNHKNLPLAERAKMLQKIIEEISQKEK